MLWIGCEFMVKRIEKYNFKNKLNKKKACRCFKWDLLWPNQWVHNNWLSLSIRVWWRPHIDFTKSFHQREALRGNVHKAIKLSKIKHPQVHFFIFDGLIGQVKLRLHGDKFGRFDLPKQILNEFILYKEIDRYISLRVFFWKRT